MMNRIFFACVLLSLYSSGSSLSCRWLSRKFRQHTENSLELLDTMANNSTNTTEDAELEVAFPRDLYIQASKASAGERLVFIVQVLKELAKLFEKDHSSASWQKKTEEDFVGVVNGQIHGLRPCIGSHSHKKKNHDLTKYFHTLSDHIKRMGHSAEAWELIRREIKIHLFRVDQLASSLLTTN